MDFWFRQLFKHVYRQHSQYCSPGRAINAIKVLLDLGVFSPEEAQEEVNMIRQHGGFGVFANIGGTEYNIAGRADEEYILEIEDIANSDIDVMENIKEFEEWVKTILTAQEPEVSSSVVADP